MIRLLTVGAWPSFAAVLLISVAGAAGADDPRAVSDEDADQAQVLVEQLGASSFVDRETASRGLIELGLAALPALREAVERPEPEIRLRARRILDVVEANDRRRRIAAFADDSDQSNSHGLAGWERFRKEVGDDEASKAMFVAMQKEAWRLLETAEREPKSASSALAAQYVEMRSIVKGRDVIGLGMMAALLFVAADDQVQAPPEMASLVYSYCSSSTKYCLFASELRAGSRKDAARKLLGNWITSDSGARGGYYAVLLALNHEMKEGIVPAQRMIDGNVANTTYRQYAVLTLAKLGGKEQIPAIEKLLDDETVCYTRTDPKTRKVQYQVRLQDVALAGLLHLSGEKPSEYGFTRIRTTPKTIYQINTTSFDNDEQRQAALKKWRERK